MDFASGNLPEVNGDYLPQWLISALVDGFGPWVAVALAVVVGAGFAAGNAAPGAQRRRKLLVAVAGAAAGVMLAVAFHRIPDEVFVSLRQSLVLAEHGRYSFHVDHNVDGTNDVLFYLALGLLNLAGIAPPLGALLVGSACLAATVLLIARAAGSRGRGALAAFWGAMLVLGSRSMVCLAGSGWSAPLVTLVFATAIALAASSRPRRAFVLLAGLPLLRYDLMFYTVLSGAGLAIQLTASGRVTARQARAAFAATLLVPAAVAVGWRLYYGHWLPTPIVLKTAAGGSIHKLIAALAAEGPGMILEFVPHLLLAAAGLALKPQRFLRLWPWLLPAFFHVVAVAWGGGDYHADHRYHVPLLITLVWAAAEGVGIVLVGRRLGRRRAQPAGRARGRRWPAFATVVMAVVLLAYAGLPVLIVESMPADRYDFFGRGAMAVTSSRTVGHLTVGRFFTWLTEGDPGVKLATSEPGPGYYAFRGIPVDPVGFTDRRIAEGPANPHPAIGVPDNRCDPGIWARERPEIIWLDVREVRETQYAWLQRAGLAGLDPQAAFQRCLAVSRHWWWTAPYFESPFLFEAYVPRLTTVNERWRILWLARKDAAPRFDARLASQGFVTDN